GPEPWPGFFHQMESRGIGQQSSWTIEILRPPRRGGRTDAATLPNGSATPIGHPLHDHGTLKLSRCAHHLPHKRTVWIVGVILGHHAHPDLENCGITPPDRRQQRLLGRKLPRQSV